MKDKILVLGVGNLILSDEGVGVHLVRRLQSENLPANVEIEDGGTQGLELLDYMDDVAKLIIVDCIKAGSEPGSIFRFEPDKVDVIPREYKISFHDLGIYDFIRLAEALDKLPPTMIFGIEPERIDWGEELSPAVEAKMDKLKEFVLKEINDSLKEIEREQAS
ncbi:MAG TPA: HyaD/HybD family hydrogenase maturation endopeptidase [Candidatus Aquicultor sp.]|jgi:hydrogenase maturation protease